jgi:hypothetical protein
MQVMFKTDLSSNGPLRLFTPCPGGIDMGERCKPWIKTNSSRLIIGAAVCSNGGAAQILIDNGGRAGNSQNYDIG